MMHHQAFNTDLSHSQNLVTMHLEDCTRNTWSWWPLSTPSQWKLSPWTFCTI